MARSADGSMVEALAGALEALGLGEAWACRVAADWAAHYPLIGRVGVERMAHALEARGLAGETALEAAGLMLALELQVRGACYQQALEGLERARVPAHVARAATLDAVGLRRRVASRPAPRPQRSAVGVLARLFS